jgi:hypothetical protein
MKISLYLFFVFACVTEVFASSVSWKPLEVLVRESDHVLLAKITNVDAIDLEGNILLGDFVESGLGSGNIFRLHLQVSNTYTDKKVPENILVKLAPDRFLTLGSYRDLVRNKKYIFLLKGNEFRPVTSGYFQRDLSEKEIIQGLLTNDA